MKPMEVYSIGNSNQVGKIDWGKAWDKVKEAFNQLSTVTTLWPARVAFLKLLEVNFRGFATNANAHPDQELLKKRWQQLGGDWGAFRKNVLQGLKFAPYYPVKSLTDGEFKKQIAEHYISGPMAVDRDGRYTTLKQKQAIKNLTGIGMTEAVLVGIISAAAAIIIALFSFLTARQSNNNDGGYYQQAPEPGSGFQSPQSQGAFLAALQVGVTIAQQNVIKKQSELDQLKIDLQKAQTPPQLAPAQITEIQNKIIAAQNSLKNANVALSSAQASYNAALAIINRGGTVQQAEEAAQQYAGGGFSFSASGIIKEYWPIGVLLFFALKSKN